MTPPRNLPNVITFSRLVLALLLFVILSLVGHAQGASAGAAGVAGWVVARERLLLTGATVIFWLAAFSDFLDGYVARRWSLQTDFGRIVDPFADKVVVCGAFVLLTPIKGSFVAPWMVVVMLARELLVDGLRGFAESRGHAFPSRWAGKVKMAVQSLAILWVLMTLAAFRGVAWAEWTSFVLVILTVIATVYSGLSYVYDARRLFKDAPGSDEPVVESEHRMKPAEVLTLVLLLVALVVLAGLGFAGKLGGGPIP